MWQLWITVEKNKQKWKHKTATARLMENDPFFCLFGGWEGVGGRRGRGGIVPRCRNVEKQWKESDFIACTLSEVAWWNRTLANVDESVYELIGYILFVILFLLLPTIQLCWLCFRQTVIFTLHFKQIFCDHLDYLIFLITDLTVFYLLQVPTDSCVRMAPFLS